MSARTVVSPLTNLLTRPVADEACIQQDLQKIDSFTGSGIKVLTDDSTYPMSQCIALRTR